ncbi:MAG: DNA polymerase III subunit delta [Ferruginibacter sp.]
MPLYIFQGEEHYYIDLLVDQALELIIPEQDRSFNQTVLYGKDTEWTALVNTCMRYPMQAERQLVVLREAQMMNGFEKLESYFENPSPSTVLILAYKGKSIDKRTKLFKTIQKQGVIIDSDGVFDNQIPDWIEQYCQSVDLSIGPKAISLLADHIGNDLTRIVNELEKLKINLKDRQTVTEDDIESFIGISKEYNIFELQAALANRNTAAVLKIVRFYEANPKAAPIPYLTAALYSFFSKLYMLAGAGTVQDQAISIAYNRNPAAVQAAKTMMRQYGFTGIQQIILLLQQYNMKGMGVDDAGMDDGMLTRELMLKILLC